MLSSLSIYLKFKGSSLALSVKEKRFKFICSRSEYTSICLSMLNALLCPWRTVCNDCFSLF